ncbi:hypothetical protein [Deinococcus apachensis]|uniref:hypothetical protein n=1 Tax=Deinococcus apachensis TaxID=309886 RepID=UPI00036806EC|nr:hypothetical protein [Deinococcus apachensis]
MLQPLWAALTLALLGVLPVAAIAQVTGPAHCRIEVIVDNVLPSAYPPVIRVAPGCPPGGYARVRKSSTLNLRRNGAPYQPVRSTVGAWNVTASSSTIPPGELWTPATWRWEWWDGTH